MLRIFALLPKRGLTWLIAVLVLPCLLTVSSTLLAWSSEQSMQSANRWVQHTLEVMSRLHSFDASASELGLSVRSFLLSRRPPDEQAARREATRLRRALEELRQLTADNPVQRRNLEQLTPQVTRRAERALQVIALEQADRHEDAVALLFSPESEALRQSVRSLSEQMMLEEQMRLEERQERVLQITHRRTVYGWVMLGANVLALFSLVFLLYWLRRLESMVRMCAWSRTVEYQGRWLSFEQYLQERFGLDTSHGISPEEAAKIFQGGTPEPASKPANTGVA